MTPSTNKTAETRPAPRADQICMNCNLPFRYGPRSDPLANVYSIDGKKEVAISGVCERCFDEVCGDE